MPIYEYQCEKCGLVIEKIQKFSDPPLSNCEKCEGKVNKLLSQSSFMLKGSGWYVTDYAKKTTSSESKNESSSSETKTESKTETKTESKTESKAEPVSTPTTRDSGSGTSGVSTSN